MQVISGYSPEAPNDRRTQAKVNSAHTDIKSGMLISLNPAGEWVKGFTIGASVNPCFAETDALDPDVVAAGSLAGLSCSGEFGILTAYFTDQALTHGDVIVSAGNTGLLKKTDGAGQAVLARVGIKGRLQLGGSAHLTDPLTVKRAGSLGLTTAAFAGSSLGVSQNSEAESSELLHIETGYTGLLTA